MSLGVLLEMSAEGGGDRIAIGPREGGTSFAELAALATRGAALIASHEPKHVVFVGRNGPAYLTLMFSAMTAGVPFVPLNYRLARAQLHDLIAELDDPLIVAESDYLSLLDEHAAVSADRLLAEIEGVEPGPPILVDDDTPAVLLFTSGTTSRPKAVLLRHHNLMSYILGTVEFASAGADEAALVSVPPYHVAAVGSALSNLFAVRRVVHLPDFDARAWLSLVQSESVTSAMVVPTMLARIVETVGAGPADTPTLHSISYGGARMPLPLLESAMRVFPETSFVNAYGLTETSSTIALLGPEDHRDAFASIDPAVRARLTSIGRPVPGIEVEIRDGHGNVLGPGQIGELWIRGRQVSGEYRGSGSVLDEQGWFATHDLAHQDRDRFLFIHGRADDTIIRGGENIAPAEIEDAIVQHPAVKEVAVVGTPDDEWGQKISAVVVLHPGADLEAEEIRAYVRERLRGSRTPDQVVWRDELPYTPTGKLLRRLIAADLLQSVVTDQGTT